MATIQHFLSLLDLTPEQFKGIIKQAIILKKERKAGKINESLKHKTLGMIFEKASTRTRISFEAGMTQLGGHAIFLSSNDSQLGRGEPLEDSARVLSRMVDIIMIRTFAQTTVETFAEYSKVPIINGLTDLYHPCQLLADMQTWFEQCGDMQGKTATWIGDGNNMCHSYINAARLLDFKLNIACPKDYAPVKEVVSAAGTHCEIFNDPLAAAKDSDLIVTDVWASMGQEEEQKKREKAFAQFQVNQAVMDVAHPDALFMHCLPAHRGEEVTAEVIEGKQSVVWDEAENRLHAQKALLLFLLK